MDKEGYYIKLPLWSLLTTLVGYLMAFSQVQPNDTRMGFVFVGITLMILPYFVIAFQLTWRNPKK